MEYINKILELYYEINSIYKRLYELELNEKKDSIEFLELVNVLKERIEKEKELFDLFYNNLDENLSCSVLDDGEPFAKRINDYMSFYETLNIPIYEDDSEEIIIDKRYDMQYAKLYKSCSRNIFLVYLSFLQEYIDMDDFNSLRSNMLSFKYYNSFINHDVEECLMDSNFQVSKVNYVNLYFVAETLGIDINMCDKVILDCFKDTVEVTVNQILSINDSDYSDNNKKAISINNQSMLRAGLSLMSKSDYDKNKDWIFDLINNLTNDNNSMVVNIINSIVNNMNKDKGRVRKISLRPFKD